MADLGTRARDLEESLAAFPATGGADWAVGPLYNAIVEQAKAELRDDAVIAALSPATKVETSLRNVTSINAGAMRAGLRQIGSALGGTA